MLNFCLPILNASFSFTGKNYLFTRLASGCCCCSCLRYVIIWYVWSWTKVSIDLYAHLTHALSEFCAYRPRVGKSLKLCPELLISWQLKYTLTVYQRPSRLEITLQAPMPTLVQLSTVGRPLFQGNHKLHVMEPFCLGRRRQPFLAVLSTISLVHHKQCEHISMYTQPVHTSSSVYTHMSIYICIYRVSRHSS